MKLFYLTAALTVVLAAGLAGSQPRHHLVRNAAEKSGACWSEMQSAMMKMHEGMGSVRQSGACDEDFVRLMLPHHQAAIDMAKTELIYGKDPALRRLAQEIITGQQSEIELMRLWLQKQKSDGQDKPETGGTP